MFLKKILVRDQLLNNSGSKVIDFAEDVARGGEKRRVGKRAIYKEPRPMCVQIAPIGLCRMLRILRYVRLLLEAIVVIVVIIEGREVEYGLVTKGFV